MANMKDRFNSLSVHLEIMPQSDASLIDVDLERRMALGQEVVSLARFLREKSKLRIRQPLRRILVPVDSVQQRRDIESVADIIKEELNIKDIEFVSDEQNIITKSAKGNFKVLGKKYGKQTQAVANRIKELTDEEIKELEREKKLTILDGITIDLEDVEITNNDIEGWLVANAGGVVVALDTQLDNDLVQEGIAREFVSKVQNLRKDSGFEVVDRISVEVFCSDVITAALQAKEQYICSETLCDKIIFSKDNLGIEIEFLEERISVKLEKL